MKTMIFTMIILLLATFATADTIFIPENSKHVDSAEFSTGGGKKAIVYIKVLITHDDGSQTLYTESKGSLSGVFGLGRLNIPKKMDFVIKNGLLDKIEWEK